MKNGKEAGKDQVNIETLKAGDETIAKQLASLQERKQKRHQELQTNLFAIKYVQIVYFAKGEPRNVEYCKVFLWKCNIWVLRTRKLPDATFFNP